MRYAFLLLILVFINSRSSSQRSNQDIWVDSMLQSMNVDEKLGQLFVIRCFSRPDEEQCVKVQSMISEFHVGGICFFKGTSPAMVDLIDNFQWQAKIPLLISMDAEWGVGMRLTDMVSFPRQMTLGAIEDNTLIYNTGREMARQLKDLGIHMNYAPVLDINNNLSNPVINERSFGSNRKKVIAKSFAYMQGLQDGGVLACIKHFPGHGDTETDSHTDLPTLLHSKQRLDSIELYPFKAIAGLKPASVMVAHLHIPALDSTLNIPATLSPNIVNTILKEEYNFEGLIITDALEMKGVTKNFSADEIALRAFKAGNDQLLLSEDIRASMITLKEALSIGEITMDQLDDKVKKILRAKYQVGLSNPKRIQLDSTWQRTTNTRTLVLKEKLYKNALTLARDKNELVPIRNISPKIVCISINGASDNPFQKRLLDYADVCNYTVSSAQQLSKEIIYDLEEADQVIISLHKLNYQKSKQYGLNMELMDSLGPLIANKSCIVTIFGCPYVSMFFPKDCSLLLAYEENELSMDVAAQMLFGTDPIVGVSPVNTAEVLEEGNGIRRPSLMKMGFSIPESQGMNSDTLNKIDSLVRDLIQQHAAPGCQVVIAKNNKIVYRKSFGHYTYDSIEVVNNRSMYDLASLTKIVSTAPVLMLMDDHNKIQIGKKFSHYLPEFKASDKADISIRDFMLHQGGFAPWIPFYKSTLISPDTLNKIDYRFYDTTSSSTFNIPVIDSLYLRYDYRDTLFQKILGSKKLDEKKYLYSDLGFYFIPKLVYSQTGKEFSTYYSQHFTKPLGLRYTSFNPLQKYFTKEQIPPTEVDSYYRHKIIQGYVHDMGAAMMGGVSGHAGLFSNASDVAIIMQMLLNHGNYGGIELISNSTVSKFTERDREFSRRALLFDMPELIDTSTAYVTSLASKRTFGHQGFTGTCAWVDPDNQLVYVFLSNRTFPDAKVNLLHKNRYRSKIQDVIYRAMGGEGEMGKRQWAMGNGQ